MGKNASKAKNSVTFASVVRLRRSPTRSALATSRGQSADTKALANVRESSTSSAYLSASSSKNQAMVTEQSSTKVCVLLLDFLLAIPCESFRRRDKCLGQPAEREALRLSRHR